MLIKEMKKWGNRSIMVPKDDKKIMHNDSDDFDKRSEASDVSAFTDMKVFNGALGKIAKINRAHEEKRGLGKLAALSKKEKENFMQPFNLESKMKKMGNVNIKIEENGISSNFSKNEGEVPLESGRKINSPLSFRTNIIEDIEKVNINKDGVINLKIKEVDSGEETDNDERAERVSKHSKKSKNSNKDKEISTNSTNINNSYNNHKQEDRQRSKSSSKEIREKEVTLLKNILSSSEDDKEADKINYEVNNTLEGENHQNNVFWNLKEGGNANSNHNESNAYKSDTLGSSNHNSMSNIQNTNFYQNRINSFNSKFTYKTATTSQISCTISKIDRGIAVLVSSDDQIFTLPVCFLPKKMTAGNSYQITIDETANLQKKVNSIQQMQKKYIKPNK